MSATRAGLLGLGRARGRAVAAGARGRAAARGARRVGRRGVVAGGAGGRGAAGRRRCRPGCASGSRPSPRCATTARRGCCAAAGSPTWTCWRSGRASSPRRRTRSSRRAMPRGSRRCCGRVPRRAWPWCRSGAGRASSAGSRASAGRSRRWCPWIWAGWIAWSSIDPWSLDRGLRAGDPAARGRRGAARAGAGAGARAAVVRVGDGRRVRGDALGGADLDRPRAHRQAGRGAGVRDAVGVACRRWTRPAPRRGPSLRELVLGSEGTLGVITQVALRVRRRIEPSYDAWSVESFMEGAELLRALEQDGLAPDIARLSDEEETRLNVALAGTGTLGRRLLDGRCLLVCGWQGAHGRARGGAEAGARRRAAARSLARPRVGEVALRRPAPARRPAGPRRRRRDAGDGDVLEQPGAALRRRCAAALPGFHVGCHISHLYPSGRVAVLHRARPPGRRPGRAVARGQGRGLAGDRRARAARSPTTTRSAATTRPTSATRSASSGSSSCAR